MTYGFQEPCSACGEPLTLHCVDFESTPSNAAWHYDCPECGSSETFEYGPYYLLKDIPEGAVAASPVVKPDPPKAKPFQDRFASELDIMIRRRIGMP